MRPTRTGVNKAISHARTTWQRDYRREVASRYWAGIVLCTEPVSIADRLCILAHNAMDGHETGHKSLHS